MQIMENNGSSGQRKSRDTLYIFIIVTLLVSTAVMTWLWIDQKSKVEFILVEIGNLDSEKMALDAELKDLLEDYNRLETDNEQITTELQEKRVRITELMEEVKKHKGDAWTLYKLRKEAATLRSIMKGYVHTIDSLNTLNIGLREDKVQITQELTEQKKKYNVLEQENVGLNEKVKIGSHLEAINIYAVAQRVKANGIHKPTTKAERTEKIKCCFTISANQLAETGKKDVYLRIIGPDGKVMALGQNDENMFEFHNVKGLYSVKKQVIYDGVELDVCLYWEVDKENPVKPGEYIVEAYSDALEIGTVKFELK